MNLLGNSLLASDQDFRESVQKMDSRVEYGVRKAVIPAAGLGARMHPLTRGTPKEILPLGQRPMIHWCIEEAFQSGIQEIGIVIRRDKKQIRDYLASLEETRYGKDEEPFREAVRRCALTLIEQPIPRGSGDAISRARSFVGDEPFAVMMPDFVLFDSRPALKQMVETIGGAGTCAVGFLELSQEEAKAFGNVGLLQTENVEGPIHRVVGFTEKKPGVLTFEKETRVFKAVGRQIFTPDFFETFDTISWEGMGERDDVPVIQRLMKERELLGIRLQGRGFDLGNLHGYYAANEYLRDQALP